MQLILFTSNLNNFTRKSRKTVKSDQTENVQEDKINPILLLITETVIIPPNVMNFVFSTWKKKSGK